MRRRSCFLVLILSALGPAALADEFDRLDGERLAAIPDGPDATARERLNLADLAGLPEVLPGLRTPLIVARTDQGNLARLLVKPALRRPQGGGGEPSPILVVERYDTFEAPKAVDRLARGRDLVLFDGFQLDLDSGHVVPQGHGGDLRFLASGEGGPRLVAVGTAKLYTLARLAPGPKPQHPSPGRAVLPGDFAGRYRLFANGQWSGTLDLEVAEKGVVSGRFRSDQTGTAYKVTGQVTPEAPQKVLFAVQLPRARLEFTGLLWTEGKAALAGTVSLSDREFGFFALREGGSFAPEGENAKLVEGGERPGRHEVALTVVDGSTESYTLDRDPRALDAAALAEALAAAAKADPSSWVVLRAWGSQPYASVARAIEAIRGAGIAEVRLAPAEPAKEDCKP